MEPEGSLPRSQHVPVLRQITPAHTVPTDLFKNRFNITLPSRPRSSKLFFPWALLTKSLCTYKSLCTLIPTICINYARLVSSFNYQVMNCVFTGKMWLLIVRHWVWGPDWAVAIITYECVWCLILETDRNMAFCL